MNRTDALAYLTGTLGKISAATGTPNTDTADGYAGVIDASNAAFGYGPDDTIPTELSGEYKLMLRYLGLRRLQLDASVMVDVQLGSTGARKSYSQLYTQLSGMIADARNDLVNAGVDVAVPGTSFVGVLNLDILEPTS